MSIILPPYNFPVSPVPNITPFTYRDGLTYLERIEAFITWINDVVIPFVNDNYSELAETFETEVTSLINTVNQALADQTEANNTAINDLQNNVNEQIGDLEGQSVEEALDALTIYINNAVSSIINSTIDVTDPVVLAILQDTDTDSYAEVISIINAQALSKTNNLSDLTNISDAREALGVYSIDETNAAIAEGAGVHAPLSPLGRRGLYIAGDSNSTNGVFRANSVSTYNLINGARVATEDNSWIGWASLNCGGAYFIDGIAATPGITPATWNTQYLDAVIARAPFAVVDALGTNNVENLSQQITALSALYDACDDAGIKVVVCSIPPKSSQEAHVQRLNRWKQSEASIRGYLFVDNYAAVVDPATGAFLSSMQGGDNIHWNAAGARAVGQAFGAAVSAAWGAQLHLAAANGQSANLITKPLMLTMAGFVPDGWTHLGGLSSGDVTENVYDVAGVKGKLFKATQGGSGGIDCNMKHTLTDLVAGHRYLLGYKMLLTVVGTAPTSALMRLELSTGGGTSLCYRNIKQSQALTTVWHEFVVPDDLSAYNYHLRWQLNGGGAGTEYGIGQVTFADLTEAGID